MKKFISVFLSLAMLISCIPYATFAQDSKNRKPKVSIIIPVYNVELYLRECLDSIVNQTLTDIQIICVDDGSTDSSLDILREYEKKDTRVMVIAQKNQGASVARNEGMKLAKGEFITFVDSDDYMALNTYETAYNRAKRDNADIIVWGFYSFYRIDDEFKIYRNVAFDNKTFTRERDNIFEEMVRKVWSRSNTCVVWNKLYKQSLISANNIHFPIEKSIGEDSVFNRQAFKVAKRVSSLPNILSYHRKYAGTSLMDMHYIKNSKIRKALKEKDFDTLKKCVSPGTFIYLKDNCEKFIEVINSIYNNKKE